MSRTVSCFTYSLLSISFMSIFLIKYRIEYILILPIVTTLFVFYLAISAAPGSSAQKPETLYRERGLIAIVVALVVVFISRPSWTCPCSRAWPISTISVCADPEPAS
jgi:hypothetical protein